MKRAVFILPYFGNLPNYFPLFLKTVSFNPMVDLMLFTDDRRPFDYPENSVVHFCSFEDIVGRFREKIGDDICLPYPKKLCDFKPTYGFVFEDLISQYEYWAYGDCDTLWGDFEKFLSPLFDAGYDKIFALGHLSFTRNTEENNRLFFRTLNGEPIWREGLCQEASYWLDEAFKPDRKDVISLFLDAGKKVFTEDYSLNPVARTLFFHQGVLDFENYCYRTVKEPLFYVLWENGKIFKMQAKRKTEFLYLHMQMRKMTYSDSVLRAPMVRIVPDSFIPMDSPSSANFLTCVSWNGLMFYLRYRYHMFVRRFRR